jgi:hypothetical protein
VPDNSRLLAVMLTGAVITLGLRTIPFAVLALLRRSPVVQHLSLAMPAGVLTILAIYFLRDIDSRTRPRRPTGPRCPTGRRPVAVARQPLTGRRRQHRDLHAARQPRARITHLTRRTPTRAPLPPLCPSRCLLERSASRQTPSQSCATGRLLGCCRCVCAATTRLVRAGRGSACRRTLTRVRLNCSSSASCSVPTMSPTPPLASSGAIGGSSRRPRAGDGSPPGATSVVASRSPALD